MVNDSATIYTILMTINVTITLIIMLAACLCCKKKKVPKNELLGLEGMVKLKNPDDVIIVTTVGNSESQVDLNLSTVSNADSEKRSSTAAHRSLPDIPVTENNGDNGSELYETVADKSVMNAQNNHDKSPTPSLKKQTSVSQHSSISQADDVSSPYSRVKNSPHDYAKVRTTEHPYAQLNAPSTSAAAAVSAIASSQNIHQTDSLHRNSQLSNGSAQNLSDVVPQAEIPAASAIAGMISASQDLPYMTPPIANQHFSGDSQDSSKGYTSISVREPLANLLAQQPTKPIQRNAPLSRDANDSHYATVSDDSDETYAAIEDPNNRHNINSATADIYTSGSETYAQIQPMQANSIIVAVEINNISSLQNSSQSAAITHSVNNAHQLEHNHSNTISNRPNSSTAEYAIPVPPPVDSLRAQMHSRQASSSSNNSSSICNLGSPKPEKRQANSPLPPTPKSSTAMQQTHHLHATSNNSLTSGRNSVISVIESTAAGIGILDTSLGELEAEVSSMSPQKQKTKSLSPSKDIEGMYAKVMKKHKFSRNSPSSQNNSPVLTRKQQLNDATLGVSPLDSAAAQLMDAQKLSLSTAITTTIANDKSRTRSNSYTAKDHGYETIPADTMRNTVGFGIENRKSDCYANILQKERQQEAAASTTFTNAKPPNLSSSCINTNTANNVNIYHREKHYETIASPVTNATQQQQQQLQQHNNCNDPGYEQLLKPHDPAEDDTKKSSDYDPNYEVLKNTAHSDDGYAKVLEKKRNHNIDTDSTDGYSKVKGDEECLDGAGGYSTIQNADANHNYASILETKANLAINMTPDDVESDHYARIAEARIPAAPELPLSTASTPAGSSRITDLPITSTSSLNSSSLLNNSSSATTVTASTSTISSRQTPSSSQYESLTGSDTDPNYESVCYLNTSSGENPYERLHDTQLSSPMTPEDASVGGEVVVKSNAKEINSTSSNVAGISSIATTTTTVEVIVDDYFQV